MNVMVFDVSAVSGGPLSILEDFYDQVNNDNNENIKWFFVLSRPALAETNNIRSLCFPWIKKSWFHRLYFDYIVASRLIRKYNVEQVISLQNTMIPRTKIPQTVYIHQSIPFVDYKFYLKDNKKLWAYQNIVGKLIYCSIKKANIIIVQTNWMKEIIAKKLGVNIQKIRIISPRINLSTNKAGPQKEDFVKTFIYPAAAYVYKNHNIIIEASALLKTEGIFDFKVAFTLNGNENRYSAQLKSRVEKLDVPIEFVGRIARKELYDLYRNSVLLFPSHAESYGLPLYEAKSKGGIILASNYTFAKEALNGYENAYFFDSYSPNELKSLMKKAILGNIQHHSRISYSSNLPSYEWNHLIRELWS